MIKPVDALWSALVRDCDDLARRLMTAKHSEGVVPRALIEECLQALEASGRQEFASVFRAFLEGKATESDVAQAHQACAGSQG
jgi:citrate lyase beta subunit